MKMIFAVKFGGLPDAIGGGAVLGSSLGDLNLRVDCLLEAVGQMQIPSKRRDDLDDQRAVRMLPH